MSKPIAESCLRNQHPIYEHLTDYLKRPLKLLELGSGTGQHAVYIAERMAHVHWQCSDMESQLSATKAWIDDAALPNLPPPVILDVSVRPDSLASIYDAVFTANTLHFVDEYVASSFISLAAESLRKGGLFFVYGPFTDNGTFTSDGDARLDLWLKQRDARSGIRSIQWVLAQAGSQGMTWCRTHQLPANNLLLVFEKN